ncbi:class I SAM-dependent methyltransferase [Candidatus Woesearchaeota archaeon]|nr:class I SAM-dependent methyltransferase [Candidatus Woesearchaeota archaeon]
MQQVETFPEEVAQIYDTIMGYFDYRKSAKIIDDILKNRLPGVANPSILELGIGTGALALELIALGYEVEGIDHSSGMLARASKKGLHHLYHDNVIDFDLGRDYHTIISHAGPLRMDYTPERGHFFETYLTSKQELKQALQNVSTHLKQDGIFLMSVQNTPGSDKKMRSTPEYGELGEFVAKKDITDNGNRRIKRRELWKGDQLIVGITHQFLVWGLEEFNELASL